MMSQSHCSSRAYNGRLKQFFHLASCVFTSDSLHVLMAFTVGFVVWIAPNGWHCSHACLLLTSLQWDKHSIFHSVFCRWRNSFFLKKLYDFCDEINVDCWIILFQLLNFESRWLNFNPDSNWYLANNVWCNLNSKRCSCKLKKT